MVTTTPLPGRPVLNAAMERFEPLSSLVPLIKDSPVVVMITRAVIVQMIRVSMKVPSIATVP